MNRFIKALKIACGILMVNGTVASAAFSDNFQADTVGATPPGWTISGTNGTTVTANVASEFGTNKFLALRDSSGVTDVFATRSNFGGGFTEKAGYLQFDIRFNQGINSYLAVKLNASSTSGCCTASTLEPIQLEFFHGAHNTNTPLLLRSRGNAEYTLITNNFPIGSWQRFRIDFASSVGPPRGTYTVNWNGITITNSYLNQGIFSSNLGIDAFLVIPIGSPTIQNVDIDNIIFIPEPTAVALTLASMIVLARWNRRRN